MFLKLFAIFLWRAGCFMVFLKYKCISCQGIYDQVIKVSLVAMTIKFPWQLVVGWGHVTHVAPRNLCTKYQLDITQNNEVWRHVFVTMVTAFLQQLVLGWVGIFPRDKRTKFELYRFSIYPKVLRNIVKNVSFLYFYDVTKTYSIPQISKN